MHMVNILSFHQRASTGPSFGRVRFTGALAEEDKRRHPRSTPHSLTSVMSPRGTPPTHKPVYVGACIKDEIRLLGIHWVHKGSCERFRADREVKICQCTLVKYVRSRTDSGMWNMFHVLLFG